jgi:hypothetical protein
LELTPQKQVLKHEVRALVNERGQRVEEAR